MCCNSEIPQDINASDDLGDLTNLETRVEPKLFWGEHYYLTFKI